MGNVLPAAMVAGGFNGNAEQANAFFTAYAQAFREMLERLPSIVQPVPPPQDEAVEASPPPKAQRRKRKATKRASSDKGDST